MEKKIKLYLVIILFAVGAVPFGASYYIVKELLGYQQQMTQNLDLDEVSQAYGRSLKKLSSFDSANIENYKNEFSSLQEKRILLAERDGVLKRVNSSIKKVYFMLFGFVSLILFALGSFLSRRISRIYSNTYSELQSKKERERYLSQFEKISDIVKHINHEIKKPLAPIETWNQNILSSYKKDGDKFPDTLEMANKVISEEVGALRKIINSFNTYSSLPEPVFEKIDIGPYLSDLAAKFNEVYEEVEVVVRNDLSGSVEVHLDRAIVSQVFQNLIENALEANPGRSLLIRVNLYSEAGGVSIDVENEGVELIDLAEIFEPHVTTKGDIGGQGLGLSISKVSLLKHGGDLIALPKTDGAKFKMTLPRYGEGVNETVIS